MFLTIPAVLGLCVAAVPFDFTISNHPPQWVHREPKHSIGGQSRRVAKAESDDVLPELNATLTPSYNFYHGNILVGSPPQKMDVLFDTGSPVSWVYGPQGSFDNAARFFPNESSSFHWENESFSAAYGSGNYLGHWANDVVYAPAGVVNGTNSTVVNDTFGVLFDFGVVTSFATTAGAPGLLGLGPHIKSAGPDSYRTLPEALYENNITQSPAFSVYLEGDGGRFIFGGVDQARVNPPFYNFSTKSNQKPESPSSAQGSNSWTVTLDSLALNHGEEYPVNSPATLDTGSPVSLVPYGFAKQIADLFHLQNYSEYQAWYTNTSADALQGWVTLKVGLLTIDIATQDLFIPGELIWLDDGPQNVTALSMVGSPNILLGDAFFRHTYTVFDAANDEIWLAGRTLHVPQNESEIVPVASVTPWPGQNPSATTVVATEVITHTATGTAPVLQNMYLGTVDAKDAASASTANSTTGTSSEATGTSSSSASGSSTTTASSSSSSSENAAMTVSFGLPALLGLLALI